MFVLRMISHNITPIKVLIDWFFLYVKPLWSKTNYAHLTRGSINSVDVIDLGSLVFSRRPYHHPWPMEATLIVNDPELASVLSGTNLSTSEGWNVKLAYQREDIGRSAGLTSTGNWTRVTRMVAQRFNH